MKEIVRLGDWSYQLSIYMEKANLRVGEWGTFDCALNCADAVLAMTGIDLAAQFRGHYNDEEGAYRELKKYGYETTMDIAKEHFETKPVCDAMSGDLATFNYENMPITGVVYKGRIFTPSPGVVGLGSIGYLKAHTAFKVGTA